jgi:hypothetical protein
MIISSTASFAAGAADRDHHTKMIAHRMHRAEATHRWRHSARAIAPIYGYAPETPPIGPEAIVGSGYVFIPGKGIVGESCDMPTSTCTNEYRDVQ